MYHSPFPRRQREPMLTSGNFFSTNCWNLGREVWIRELAGRVEISCAHERIAVHPLCAGRHHVLTEPQHHQGIPFDASLHRSPGTIAIQVSSPQVEVRPLAVYEAVGAGGGGA